MSHAVGHRHRVIAGATGGVEVAQEPQGVPESAEADDLRVLAEPEQVMGALLGLKPGDHLHEVVACRVQVSAPERTDPEEVRALDQQPVVPAASSLVP